MARAIVMLLISTAGCASAPGSAPAEAPGKPPPSSKPAAPSESASLFDERLDVHRWRIIERESGPDNYYRVVDDQAMPFIQARYRPPFKTAVLGFEIDEATRAKALKVSWKWRAVTLPQGGNECVEGKGDSAANVYFTWKHGLKYYTLKYVWSAIGKKGAVCAQKRNPFVSQDTVILESAASAPNWVTEQIDLKDEFRKHFESGNPNAEVPGFLGIGIMTDGDQTQSESAADYADFVVHRTR